MKMMITDFKKILFTLILFSSAIFAQEASGEYPGGFNLSIPTEVLQYQFNSQTFLDEMNRFYFTHYAMYDTSATMLSARMMIGAFNSRDEYGRYTTKMLTPLYNSYMASQDNAVWRKVLGAIQLGGAAYLAYKHLRKYGFLKKKK